MITTDIWGWLRLLRLERALTINLSVSTDLTDNYSGSARSVCCFTDLVEQVCSSKLDQIFKHRVVGLNSGSARLSWHRVRTVLGSIGEKLACAICHSAQAKLAGSKVGLGIMSSPTGFTWLQHRNSSTTLFSAVAFNSFTSISPEILFESRVNDFKWVFFSKHFSISTAIESDKQQLAADNISTTELVPRIWNKWRQSSTSMSPRLLRLISVRAGSLSETFLKSSSRSTVTMLDGDGKTFKIVAWQLSCFENNQEILWLRILLVVYIQSQTCIQNSCGAIFCSVF